MPAAAQSNAATDPRRSSSATLHELALRDGSRLYGAVQKETDLEVVFLTQSGTEVTARREDILSLRLVKGSIVNGEFQRADPNATRLFFGPTGRALEQGQVYLGVYEFLLPFVQVGVTDKFSIGGGTPLFFTFDFDDGDDLSRAYWVTPKLQLFRNSSSAFSIGAFHVFGGGGNGGVAYGVGTFGRDDSSISVGAGIAYAGAEDAAGVLMLGGERRVGRSIKLMTENYIWKDGKGVASAGIRFFGERLSADLALGVPLGADDFILFPVVNFVYVFDRRQ
jgi:hypothetical protein